MITKREQIVDLIFSLSKEQLEELRREINQNMNFSDSTKETMNKVIDNAQSFNTRFLIIKKYIDEYDFYSLLDHGAPNDEFDAYTRKLTDQISAEDSVESISEKIAMLLDKAFSETVNPEKYMEIAQKIKMALKDSNS